MPDPVVEISSLGSDSGSSKILITPAPPLQIQSEQSKAWQLMQKDLRMKTDFVFFFVLPRSETRIFCNTFLRDIP